ncbi:hypothetical protein [Nocardioides pantholopis]|uniref:hypothetical protein n=1 Tax=Nocardioides pantholopis TaxID=2483798 RepID=UPI000FD76657|nr:hypothetical protein [Nocardioides pantholopis]
MSGSQNRPEDGHAEEPVGSVAEEAAKLFGALADAAGQQQAGLGSGLSGLFAQAAGRVGQAQEHLARPGPDGAGPEGTGPGEDCAWCPVCRAAHVVRRTSPEVRAHLATAASSLLQAAAGLLATTVADPAPGSGRGTGNSPRASKVEKIDLDEPDQNDGPGADA